ncbi:RNA-directed DNA polymerase, eukaryota, reverse transcriptase zinc-binding domain protein [Tanacetum coccineum]
MKMKSFLEPDIKQDLEDSLLQAGNSCQGEFPLKGILPDHRSVLTDPKIHIKMDVVVPDSSRDVFRNSDACYHDPEKCEHAGPKVTTSHGGNTTTRRIKRFTVDDDLKESSKITQTVRSKWLFKKKTDMDGNIHSYKARLIGKGFTQSYRVDYEETFSHIADIKAIRIVIAISAFYDYEIWKIDVNTSFLNGHLNEDVYMVQPDGYYGLKTMQKQNDDKAANKAASVDVNDSVEAQQINKEEDREFEELNTDRTGTKEASTPSSTVFRSWDWTSNVNFCPKGCRIILGWNVDVVSLMVIAQSSQALHVKIIHKANNDSLYVSFIYAGNHLSVRCLLWIELDVHKQVVRNSPWVLLRDFNVALNMEDVSSGSSSMNAAMNDFKDCVANIEVLDVNCSGLHYTWNQKPKGSHGILKKLDLIMGNLGFVDKFPGAHAVFQPYRISDHVPAVLKFPTLVVQKLKVLKKPLRKLLHDQGNLHERVSKIRLKLDEVQKALDKNPDDISLRDEEAIYVQAFSNAKLDEERFLKQKAKVVWLEAEDANMAYFHKTIKSRNHRSPIMNILNSNGIEVIGLTVPKVFVTHYEHFLGTSMPCDELNVVDLFVNKVTDGSNAYMVRDITVGPKSWICLAFCKTIANLNKSKSTI